MQQDAHYSPPLNVASGKIIYARDRLDDAIYLVERGQVKVSQITESGKSCLLGIYVAGNVFGETSVVGAGRSAEMAVAMRPTVLRKMSSVRFWARLREGGLFEDFARHLAMRVLEQQLVITELATLSSEYRLATTLVRLSCTSEGHGPHNRQIKEPISCQELSEMVGTTRSRIGYFLKKFRELGLIATTPLYFLLINEDALIDYVQAALKKEISPVPKEEMFAESACSMWGGQGVPAELQSKTTPPGDSPHGNSLQLGGWRPRRAS
jgi:CRP/FNR family transcriptional regulator, cyclic AMP receptor protein